jgi:hypothetical protein
VSRTFRHADRARLFALLAPFPHVLVLSAHTHAQQHVWHGADAGWTGATPLHEYNVGAACGCVLERREGRRRHPDTHDGGRHAERYARLRVGADAHAASALVRGARAVDAHMRPARAARAAPRRLARAGVTANVWMGEAATAGCLPHRRRRLAADEARARARR